MVMCLDEMPARPCQPRHAPAPPLRLAGASDPRVETLIKEAVVLAACDGPGPPPAPASLPLSITSELCQVAGGVVRVEADVVSRTSTGCLVLVGVTGADGLALGWAVGRVRTA